MYKHKSKEKKWCK